MRLEIDTVDGRNPAPVDMVNIPLFTGIFYIHPKWISEPSTVCLNGSKTDLDLAVGHVFCW